MSFSERHGYRPPKDVIQYEDMDMELRTSLWNALDLFYWRQVDPQYKLLGGRNDDMGVLLMSIWIFYFKKPWDETSESWKYCHRQIREYFFKCEWNEVYDFVDFVANNFEGREQINLDFVSYCNEILEREVSGYRFIEKSIVPISSVEEATEIADVLKMSEPFRPVVTHIKAAMELFSDRESPDYRNSIKESISAVEAICNIITGRGKATLGEALKQISDQVELHPALRKAFGHLYGYTSDADGIRHALLDESRLDFEDAKFMLVSCSAFINYLKLKMSKAGIDLETG